MILTPCKVTRLRLFQARSLGYGFRQKCGKPGTSLSNGSTGSSITHLVPCFPRQVLCLHDCWAPAGESQGKEGWASHEKGTVKPQRGKETEEERKEDEWDVGEKVAQKENNGACRRVDVSLLPARSPQEVGVLQGEAGWLRAPHPPPEPGPKEGLRCSMMNDWLYSVRCWHLDET